MKTKTKLKNKPAPKPVEIKTAPKGIVLAKDAESKVLYRTNYKHTAFCFLVKKDTEAHLHTIIVWAEYLKEWLEVRVGDGYELVKIQDTTRLSLPLGDGEDVVARGQMLPSETDLEYGRNYDRRFARKERKQAKMEGKKVERKQAVAKVNNLHPITGFRLGTNKCKIGEALLSSKDPKKVMASVHSLIIGFLKEKGKDTSDQKFVHSHSMGYIRWACQDNPTPFKEILAALEVNLK